MSLQAVFIGQHSGHELLFVRILEQMSVELLRNDPRIFDLTNRIRNSTSENASGRAGDDAVRYVCLKFDDSALALNRWNSNSPATGGLVSPERLEAFPDCDPDRTPDPGAECLVLGLKERDQMAEVALAKAPM